MADFSAQRSAAAANTAIGVVIVSFNSSDVILDCVESLLSQEGGRPHVFVVDNASSDDTVAVLRDWAAGRAGHAPAEGLPFVLTPVGKPVSLAEFGRGDRPAPDELGDVNIIHAGVNGGYAGGVNIGLEFIGRVPAVAHFWVLNPDAVVAPTTVRSILQTAADNPGYGMMGGRVLYADLPHRIQIDGGRIDRWTGVTHNMNLGRDPETTPLPDGGQLDFVVGASIIASRQFVETVGPMREDYFLYYEEVDWACRRGALPIVQCPGHMVYHHAGTAIGSPTLERLASPFSFWFKYRSRMMFVRRFNPVGLPVAMAYATAKAGQLMLKGAWPQAGALLRAVYGLGAPKEVRARLSPEAARIAFGRPAR
jgi:GT2 family glycosyltransferase